MGKLAVVILLALLAAAVWLAVQASLRFQGGALPGTGVTALALGVGFSLVVGIGLMALVFYSSRKGYDEPPRFDGDHSQTP